MADRPPAYKVSELMSSDTNKITYKDEEQQSVGVDEPTTRSKPVVIYLRRRNVRDAKAFVVENFTSLKLLKISKDVQMVGPTTTFEEMKYLLQLRARAKGVIPEQSASGLIRLIFSIETNYEHPTPDVVEMDDENWEAGREVLLTKEGAVLRLDVAIME